MDFRVEGLRTGGSKVSRRRQSLRCKEGVKRKTVHVETKVTVRGPS